MSDYERRAQDVERELDDMEQQSERLGEEIDETRQDWERKQHDSSVPGAAGDPEHAEGEPPPEQQYPDKRD
jgi:predicted  nucleic acid-binding Zn-ribbon protein